MFQDKTLICKECGNEFVFTAGEQELCRKGLRKRAPALQSLPRCPQGRWPRSPRDV